MSNATPYNEDKLEGKSVREWVLWLTHAIRGNGGKGILTRVNEIEQEHEFIRTNYVDKTECQKNRVADYSNLESKLESIREQVDKLYKMRVTDKRMTIAIVGIIASTTMSAISVIINIGF